MTIQIRRQNGTEYYKILGDVEDTDLYGAFPYNFYNNNIPYQIRLNNKSLSSINNTIKLEDELNTIEIIWNKILTDLNQMFAFCDKIESIDFSNFDFSQVITANHLMYECRGLKYVNFGNANLTEVREMSYMFYNCSSLEKVDNCFTNI